MKKFIAALIAFVMLLASLSAYALDINMAYYDFKTAHGEFVKSLTDQGLSDSQIITFVYDLYEYLKKIDSTTPVTEDNFEKLAVDAIFEVSSQEAHYPFQDALLILYPEAIKLAVTQNIVHDDFKPLVETIKKILFSSDEFGNNNSSNNSPESDNPPEVQPVIPNSFTDIVASHWAHEAISQLAANFILNGYLDGSFKPENNITRAEFAKIIVSATNTYDYLATSAFTDVASDAWYYSYVSTAYKLGYITGYPDGSFHPEDNITRADICTIVNRALKAVPNSNITAFADDGAIPAYAKDSVYALAAKKIINGFTDGTFAPKAYATRAQTAKIIYTAFLQN